MICIGSCKGFLLYGIPGSTLSAEYETIADAFTEVLVKLGQVFEMKPTQMVCSFLFLFLYCDIFEFIGIFS